MPERDKPLFLARETYHRRRMIDAARLLPVFGAVLFLVPILWDLAGPRAVDAQAAPGLAQRGLYLFAVWGGLVLAAAVLAARLRPVAEPDTAASPRTVAGLLPAAGGQGAGDLGPTADAAVRVSDKPLDAAPDRPV
jgi:hypothetical protein